MRRSVFVVSWGRNGSASISFHKCLLILDSTSPVVSAHDPGTIFDWGSKLNHRTIKTEIVPQERRFDQRYFLKGQEWGNTYRYIGCTDWKRSHILSMFHGVGNDYYILFNNCRDVAELVADHITIPLSKLQFSETFHVAPNGEVIAPVARGLQLEITYPYIVGQTFKSAHGNEELPQWAAYALTKLAVARYYVKRKSLSHLLLNNLAILLTITALLMAIALCYFKSGWPNLLIS